MLAVDQHIFGYRDSFILKRIAIGRKSSSSSSSPTSSLRLYPNDVVNKVITFIDEDTMQVKRYCYSLRCFVSIGAAKEYGCAVDNKESAFVQDSMGALDDLSHLE